MPSCTRWLQAYKDVTDGAEEASTSGRGAGVAPPCALAGLVLLGSQASMARLFASPHPPPDHDAQLPTCARCLALGLCDPAVDPEEEAKWVAFDAMVESWLGGSKPRAEVASYADQEEKEAGTNVLCARCYSLRHYGWVQQLCGAVVQNQAGCRGSGYGCGCAQSGQFGQGTASCRLGAASLRPAWVPHPCCIALLLAAAL